MNNKSQAKLMFFILFGMLSLVLIVSGTVYFGSSHPDPYQPENNTRTMDDRNQEFLFNETSDNGISNCSLLLSIDGGAYTRNTTLEGQVIHNKSILTDETVLNLWFEGNSTNIADGTINNGSITGGIVNATGKVGDAYEFDGVNSYVLVPYDKSFQFENSTDFTITMWVKWKEGDGDYILGTRKGGATRVGYNFETGIGANSGKVYFHLVDDSDGGNTNLNYGSSTALTSGNWHHIAHVADRDGNGQIYIDGVADGVATAISTVENITSADNLYIGSGDDGGNPFNGSIDEVLIFNRTLTSGEISQIYNDSKGVNFDGYNNSVGVSFAYGEHEIDWKVGCYDTSSNQYNSSQMELGLDALVTQSAPNIGAHAWYDPESVVGQWRFEQSNGTRNGVFDETGLNNCTVVGAKWCPDEGDSQRYNCGGRIGKGMLFDGLGSNYLDCGNDASLQITTNEITLATWVKQRDLGNDGLISKRDGAGNRYSLLMDAVDYSYNFQIDAGGVTTLDSNVIPDLDSWYYVVGVYDGEFMRIYVDGQQKNSVAKTGNIDAISAPFVIGAALTTSQYFNGTIDEVTIWNRSLSAIEVKQLYYSSAVSYNSTYTNQDISASPNNTADDDNDTIRYIYNWYQDNKSITLLNMPFEAVNNGSEMNFTEDYSGNDYDFSTHFDSDVFNGDSGWNRTGGYDGRGAYSFDGSEDYVKKTVSDWRNSDTQGTISAWIKVNLLGVGNQAIFSSSDEATQTQYHIMRLDNNGALELYNTGGTDEIRSTNTVTAGRWAHVVLSSTGSQYRMYINGVEETLVVEAGSDSGNWFDDVSDRDNIIIGITIDSGGTRTPFNGTIDEVMVFNRSLSAEQVRTLYYNQSQTIVKEETISGDFWKATIWAHDGYGHSIPYNTSELNITQIDLNVTNLFPKTNTNWTTHYLNFTYNATDFDEIAGIHNCSLWLEKANVWQLNKTKFYPDVERNQTFNITIEDGHYNWTVACYDFESEQYNSTTGAFIIGADTTPPYLLYRPPTPANGTLANNITINQTVSETNYLANYTLNWNGTNYTHFYSSNLVGMWSFNNNSALGENDSYIYDSSLMHNHGYANEDLNFTSQGRYRGALSFNRSTQYIILDNTNGLDFNGGNYSIGFWAKIETNPAGNRNYLLDARTGNAGEFAYFIYSQSGDIHFGQTDGTATATQSMYSSIPYPYNEWHYFTMTRNATDIDGYNIYIDGRLKHSNTIANVGDASDITLDEIILGCDYTATYCFNGTIDELRIWNYSLSADEINISFFSNFDQVNSTDWNFYFEPNENISDGEYYYETCADDYLGNNNCTGTDYIRYITLDTTGPTTENRLPYNNTNISSPYINFTFNTTDYELTVDSCNLWLKKGTSWELNKTESTIAEGIHNNTINITIEDSSILWLIECNDTFNNKANSSTYNLTVDITEPTLSLAPANNSNLVGTAHTLRYNVSDENLNNCTLLLESAGIEYIRQQNPALSGVNYTESFTSLRYGVWQWYVECSDYAGNTKRLTYEFTNHESTAAATGSGGGGAGGVSCPDGFELISGLCTPKTEEPLIDTEELIKDQEELINKAKEEIREIVGGVKTNFQIIVRYSLVLLNLLLIYKIYKKGKLRRKAKKGIINHF